MTDVSGAVRRLGRRLPAGVRTRLRPALSRWLPPPTGRAAPALAGVRLRPDQFGAIQSRPSFKYKLEEAKRRLPLMQSLEVKDPFHHYSRKLEDYKRAKGFGVDHPQLLATVGAPAELDWDALPASFVLKPQWGAFHRGVFALVRTDDDRFEDILRDRTLGREDIVAELARQLGNKKVSRQIMVEELVLRPGSLDVAYDWKVYVFHDRVGLLMQRDLRRSADPEEWVVKCYDRDLADLGEAMVSRAHDHTLPPPRDGVALIAAAELLSSNLDCPFIRVDLYESDRGPLLGELSNLPGGDQLLLPELDVELGRLWERAETLLRVRERAAQ